jgi:hypothetical protein
MALRARILVLLLAGASVLPGVRPTPDTVGPLTAKVEGPEKMARTNAPEQYSVVLDNAGDTELQGAVRVQGIDRWRVEPAGPASRTPRKRGSGSRR